MGGVGSIGWELTTLNPPYASHPGPSTIVLSHLLIALDRSLDGAKKPEDLDISTLAILMVLCENSKDDDRLVASVKSGVDIREIAEAHVIALEKPEAGGERIQFTAGER